MIDPGLEGKVAISRQKCVNHNLENQKSNGKM